MKIKLKLLFLLLSFAMAMNALAAGEGQMPERPVPARLVNDFAGVLGDVRAMEDSLEQFSNETSNQILVVTVKDLGDLEPWEYALNLGRKWGVGMKGKDNGVIVLVKPKTAESRGRVAIQVGYGLEGVLTDGFCSEIIDHEIIPEFKKNDYAAGVWAALKVIMPAVQGEINEKSYKKSHGEDVSGVQITIYALLLFGLFLIAVFSGSSHSGRRHNSRHTGTWGGPTYFGGGSSFGSGGGSWGGFGGGSFGGGGASGSW